MALYQVDIEKAIATETWTNVWYVEAADLAAAKVSADTIVVFEKAIHKTNVNFRQMRIRLAGVGNEGTLYTLSGSGGVTAPANSLPLFNTARMELSTVGGGRPSRKYFRLPIGTGDVLAIGDLQGATLTALTSAYNTHLAGTTFLRDVDGQAFSSAAWRTPIQMRQLRRGSKRRESPVLS